MLKTKALKNEFLGEIINVFYTLSVIGLIFYCCTLISSFISQWIVIPGNIIGMGALFTLLNFNFVKYERIQRTSHFLLKHIGLFFIPFTVGVMKYYSLIAANLLAIVITLIVSTILAITITAVVLERMGE